MKIGFIGLGVMGAPMARHLADAGHQIVTVLNRSSLPNDLKATVAASPADETEHTKRIRVHIVDPGATRTRMRQLAFPGEEPESVKPPEVVAEFILGRVLSDAATGELVRAPDA